MSGRIGHGQLDANWAGSISTGTLRTQDLIPVYAQALARAYSAHFSLGTGLPRLTPTTADLCSGDDGYQRVLEFDRIYQAADTLREFYQQPSVWVEGLLDPGSEMVQQIGDDMFEALTNAAPEGFYFGTAEGDGADFGFWPAQSDEEEANIVYDTNPNDDPVLTYDVLREAGACDEWRNDLEELFGEQGIPVNLTTFKLLTSMGDERPDRKFGSRGLGMWMINILQTPSLWNATRQEKYLRAILGSFAQLVPQFVRAVLDSGEPFTDEVMSFLAVLMGINWTGTGSNDVVDLLADLVVPYSEYNRPQDAYVWNVISQFRALSASAWEFRQHQPGPMFLRTVTANAHQAGEAMIRSTCVNKSLMDRDFHHAMDVWMIGLAYPFLRDAMIEKDQALDLTAEPVAEEAATQTV